MYGDGIGIEELEQCDGRSSLVEIVGVVAVLLPHVPHVLDPDLAFRQLGPRGFPHWNHCFFCFFFLLCAWFWRWRWRRQGGGRLFLVRQPPVLRAVQHFILWEFDPSPVHVFPSSLPLYHPLLAVGLVSAPSRPPRGVQLATPPIWSSPFVFAEIFRVASAGMMEIRAQRRIDVAGSCLLCDRGPS